MKIFKVFTGKLSVDNLGNYIILDSDKPPVYFIDFIKSLAHKFKTKDVRISIEFEVGEREK